MNLRSVLLSLTLAVAVVSAQQQGTPAPTTVAPKPTPAPTTVAPKPTTVAPKPTPAPTKATPKPTPAVTTTKPAATPAVTKRPNCREVSVEGDATYCIQGPICSGRGDKPAGSNCPVVGDVAVKHCLKKLKSYTAAGNCVAPVNAVCKKIKTGAWGCAWNGAPANNNTSKPTPAPTTAKPNPGQPTPAPTTAKPNPGQPTSAPTAKPTPAPTGKPGQTTAAPSSAKSFAAEGDATSSGASTGAIAGVVGAVAAVAIVGAVVYTRKVRQQKENAQAEVVEVVTP
jgi:hypothetical protein